MRIEGLEKGEYIVTIRVKPEKDSVVSFYTNHRRIAASKVKLRGNEERSIVFSAALREADFQKKPGYDDDFIEVIASENVEMNVICKRRDMNVVYVLGDSTVCDQIDRGENEFSTYCGWGQTLTAFLGGNMAVSNHAEQGTTTKDCLNFHFKKVHDLLKPGDVVIMQFGHNDQKVKELTPEKYGENLEEICRRAKEKGVTSVICSPINRLIYVDGKLNDYLSKYAKAASEAAERSGARFIDLHALSSNTYENMGDEAEKLFCRKEQLDRTHPSEFGALSIGSYVAIVLRALNNMSGKRQAAE